MNPFAGMSGLTRNPLGILAIFLGVLYGIAGLLLGSRADALSQTNQTILTLLLFIFPFVTLGMFAWLVVNHHTKLYGPADFRSDSGFLASAKAASPKEIENKIEQEATVIEGSDAGEMDSAAGAGPKSGTPSARKTITQSATDGRMIVRNAESQVLGLLEPEFDSIRRAVKFETPTGRSVIVDAIGRKGDRFTLIEVITVRLRSTFEARVRDFGLNLLSIEPPVRGTTKTDILVAVVWLDSRPANVNSATKRLQLIFKKVGLERVRVREFTIVQDGAVTPVTASSAAS